MSETGDMGETGKTDKKGNQTPGQSRNNGNQWSQLGQVPFAGEHLSMAERLDMENAWIDAARQKIAEAGHASVMHTYYSRIKNQMGAEAQKVEQIVDRQIFRVRDLLNSPRAAQLFNLEQLQADADYEERLNQRFGRNSQRDNLGGHHQEVPTGGYQADALEALFAEMVGEQRVLSSRGEHHFNFSARVLPHTRFDDYRNKVDLPIAITIENTKKQVTPVATAQSMGGPEGAIAMQTLEAPATQTPEAPATQTPEAPTAQASEGATTLYMALDVTVANTEQKMLDKLAHDTNDQELEQQLPRGFTEIRYRLERKRDAHGRLYTETRPLRAVPHYRLALSAVQVDHLLWTHQLATDRGRVDPDLAETLSDGNIRSQLREQIAQPITPEDCRNMYAANFKILHEISLQNELFETELYARLDAGNITEEEQACLTQLEGLDQPLLQDLDFWTDQAFLRLFSREKLEQAQVSGLNRCRIVSEVLRSDDQPYDALLRAVESQVSS